VELFEAIRRDERREGLSIRALADRHRVHRRTVRQALENAVPPERKAPERSAPKLDPAKALIDAGRVKSLAIMAPERNPQFNDVPTLKEATGVDFTVGAWRGIAGPKGMPKEAVDAIVPLLQKISASPDFQGFMNQRGFGMIFAGPADFEKFMAERDAAFAGIMGGLGLVKKQ